jgi:hypothetical protein
MRHSGARAPRLERLWGSMGRLGAGATARAARGARAGKPNPCSRARGGRRRRGVRHALARHARLEAYAPGAVLCRAGERVDRVIVTITGQVGDPGEKRDED